MLGFSGGRRGRRSAGAARAAGAPRQRPQGAERSGPARGRAPRPALPADPPLPGPWSARQGATQGASNPSSFRGAGDAAP